MATDARQNRILQAALLYASYGLRVLAVGTSLNDKQPRGEDGTGTNWPATCTDDEERILETWGKWPDAMLGVQCGPESRLVDININEEGPGTQVMVLLFGGEIPITWTYRSRRGLHYWFRWREGLPPKARYFIGGRVLEVIPGNGNAQTVAPPSVCDEVEREWLPGLSPQECELAEISDAALAALVNYAGMPLDELTATTPHRPAKNWAKKFAGAVVGERNVTAAEILGKILEHCDMANKAEVAWRREAFRGWNRGCTEPLPEQELEKVWDSITTRAAADEHASPDEQHKRQWVLLRDKLGQGLQRIVQRGTEEDACYELIYSHKGDEITVVIGTAKDISKPEHIKACIRPCLKWTPKLPKTIVGWESFATSIVDLAETISTTTREEQTIGWIMDYFQEIGVARFKQPEDVLSVVQDSENGEPRAVWEQDSFGLHDGTLFINARDMVRVLNRYGGERLTEKLVTVRLSALGFANKESDDQPVRIQKKVKGRNFNRRFWRGRLPESLELGSRTRRRHGEV